MNENDINAKKEEEKQDEYNDEFNFKETDLNKNEKNSYDQKADKESNININNNKENTLKESILINNENKSKKEEEEEYGNNEFIKDNEEILDKKEEINIKQKNEENKKNESILIENNPQINEEKNNDGGEENKENNNINDVNKIDKNNININNESKKEEEEEYGNNEFIKDNEEILSKDKKEEINTEKKNEEINNKEIEKDKSQLNKEKNESQIIQEDNQINNEIQNKNEKEKEKDKNIENNINDEKKKKEKKYIEEFRKEMANDIDNDNDNYENNVSDFLEKDNVHLGPYENNQKEPEINDKNENEKQNQNENDNKENIDNNNNENKKEEDNKKPNYVLIGKESSKSKNSELMSETELLRMSVNEEKNNEQKNKNEINKEEESQKDKQIQNITNEKEEAKNDETKKDPDNNRKDIIINDEKKQINDKVNNEYEEKEVIKKNEEPKEKEIKKEELKEEEVNFSHKGSESLIESIVMNEIEEMPKNEVIINNNSNNKIIKRPNALKKIEIIREEKKYITLKDLEKEPYKKLKIDSPRSLKIIQENGYTKEELLYIPMDKFLFTHKETINMNKLEQKTRFNFYEQLRINKIKKLCELRDKLIQEESKNINNFEISTVNKYEKINENKNTNNNSKYKTIYLTHNNYEKIINKDNDNDNELIKKIILENEERILDNKLERMKAINNIELANLVEYELDKNLFKMQLNKQAENYTREIKKLKFEDSKLKDTKKINIKLKNSGNNKPVINKFTTFNENLLSFHVAKRIKEYDIFQQKLDQKLEKIEMANKKKNEKFQMKKKMEYERAKLNLKKSNDIFNRKQNELIKKIKVKDLITHGIKKMINEKNLIKNEINAQKYLSKQDYINKLKKIDEYEREQKYNNFIERESKRDIIQNMKNRIYSSRIYRMNDIQKNRKKNIYKIQKILKNGEGEDEENLDILMEEFPDNPKIAEIIKRYQIKKNNIENSYKSRPRLYSSNNININLGNNNPQNKYVSQSIDKKRIFIYANNKGYNIKNKNDQIKKEVRRINTTNKNNEYKTANNVSTKQLQIQDSDEDNYYDDEENEFDFDDNEDVIYEHEIAEKVRKYKVRIYKNFLNKLKIEKKNEMLRNKQLEIVTDMTLKKNLEIQFSQERTLVDMRLKKESERLQKQAKDYESNLRNNFQQKQERFVNQIKDEKSK